MEENLKILYEVKKSVCKTIYHDPNLHMVLILYRYKDIRKYNWKDNISKCQVIIIVSEVCVFLY